MGFLLILLSQYLGMKNKMYTLKLQIVKEAYPFSEEQGSEGNWAHIKLDILDENAEVFSVVNARWYPLELLEWFFVNRHKLLKDELRIQEKKSIAETISNYYQGDSCYTKVDYLLGYRMTHCLNNGLKGLDILETYIGKSGEGHELSIKTKDINIRYSIDLPQFFRDLEKQVVEFF